MFKSLYLNSVKLNRLRMYFLVMPIKIKMLKQSRLSLSMVICGTTKASNLVNDHSKRGNTGLVNGFNLFSKSKWLLSKGFCCV